MGRADKGVSEACVWILDLVDPAAEYNPARDDDENQDDDFEG